MPELPDSFFKDIEKAKSVPGAESEGKEPRDNSQHDLDKYLKKAQPPIAPGELTPDHKIPKGERFREDLYYDYHIEKPPENVGTSGDCTLYRVKVTCIVRMKVYWLRKNHDEVLIDDYDFATQWVAWKLIMICPDGSITDLGYLDVLKGNPDSRPDSKIDLGQPGTAGGPTPPLVYRPPTGILDDPYASLHLNDNGVDYLELRSNYWQFVLQKTDGCFITATYKKRLRIERKVLPNGPTSWRIEDIIPTDYRNFTWEIPGCNHEVFNPPPGGAWEPPKSYYEPTQGTSKIEGSDTFLIYIDTLWIRLDSPPMEINGCVVTSTYQAYTQVKKIRVPVDPNHPDPAPTQTPVDPICTKKFSFRIPGCTEELFTMIPEKGHHLTAEEIRRENNYQDLRVALASSLLSQDHFDLQRTYSLLKESIQNLEQTMIRFESKTKIKTLDIIQPIFQPTIEPVEKKNNNGMRDIKPNQENRSQD